MRAAKWALAVVLCVLALAGGNRAWAHAVLTSTMPVDGAVLRLAPDEIVLHFNEPVVPVRVRVLDLQAQEIADGSAVGADGNLLHVPLPGNLGDGVYVVTYRVTSVDAHLVTGTLTFAIGEAPPGFKAAEPTASETGWLIAYATARFVMTLGCFIACGGVIASWRLNELHELKTPGKRNALAIFAGVAALAAIVLLAVKGGQLVGGPPQVLANPATWRVAFGSTTATSVIVMVGGLVFLIAGILRNRRCLTLAGAMLALISFGLSGHAATAAPGWLLAPAVILHVACAAFWLGSLAPLLSALRQDGVGAYRTLARFSGDAVKSVAVLLALGVALAVFQVTHLPLLWETSYGCLLIAKLTIVSLLLATAIFNKWCLTPRLLSGGPTDIQAMRRSIGVEYGLFAAILAITALMSSTEPPRAAVERDNAQALAGKSAFTSVQDIDGYRITLSVSPAAIGHNALVVDTADPDGKPFKSSQVSLTFTPPLGGMEPTHRTLGPDETGRFIHHGTELSFAGDWRIEVRVLVDDFTDKSTVFTVPIR